MPLIRRLRNTAVAFIAIAGSAAAQTPADATPWLDDLAALERGLATSYANFEYTLRERRIDLPSIDRTARAALAAANDDAARRAALDTVVAAFRDPHLRIDWNTAVHDDAPGPACPASLRAKQDAASGVRFDRLDGYAPLASDAARDYKAALYQMPGTRGRFGVVRIGAFIERAFGRACAAGAAAIGIAPDAPCDAACERRLDPAVGRVLDESLATAIDELRRGGAQRLVVDLTDNGGGSDWVEAVVRIVGGPVRAARVGMLKHPSWERHLDAQLARIDSAPAAERASLAPLRAAVARDRAALAQSCDLAAAWTDRDLAIGNKAPPCSTLVVGALYSTGFAPYAAPANAVPTDLDASLFVARRYGAYRERKPVLPVTILVNENTHSSAELMAAVLRDAGRATIVGATSAGAGCGQFTDAGAKFTLPHSGATVHAPDCVRLRADGSNERRGVAPDVSVPWGPSDSAYQRAQKTAAALVRGKR
jgi:hypothetical protein